MSMSRALLPGHLERINKSRPVQLAASLARPLEDRDANASFGYAGRCVVVGLLLVFIWAQAGPQRFVPTLQAVFRLSSGVK